MADPSIPHLPLDLVERMLSRRREETPDREALARPYLGFELGLGDLIHAVLLLSFSAISPAPARLLVSRAGGE
jgi:hypothetical protein